MVGIFSRFSAAKAIGLFSHASPDAKEEIGTVKEVAISPANHGVEPAEEFLPIEHPKEPPENDQPVRCPQPEPCIIHDGQIWKERLQLSMKRRGDLPFIRENEVQGVHRRRRTLSSERLMFPSASAPEGSITKLLE